MKFGQNSEIWLKLGNLVNNLKVGMVWYGWQRLCNECWKRLCNPEQLISEGVTKVGIELLGQLKMLINDLNLGCGS